MVKLTFELVEGDSGRRKPPYNPEALEKNIVQIDKNIRHLRLAIAREEQRKVELQGYLQAHEDYDAKKQEEQDKRNEIAREEQKKKREAIKKANTPPKEIKY